MINTILNFLLIENTGIQVIQQQYVCSINLISFWMSHVLLTVFCLNYSELKLVLSCRHGLEWWFNKKAAQSSSSPLCQVVLFRNLCAMYASQSPKHHATAWSQNKQSELLVVQVVKVWMKRSAVHIPWLIQYVQSVLLCTPWLTARQSQRKNRQIKSSTHQRREKWDDKRGKTSIKLFSNSLLRLY